MDGQLNVKHVLNILFSVSHFKQHVPIKDVCLTAGKHFAETEFLWYTATCTVTCD